MRSAGIVASNSAVRWGGVEVVAGVVVVVVVVVVRRVVDKQTEV